MRARLIPLLALTAVLAMPAFAMGAGSGLGLRGLGGQVSFVDPEEVDSTFGLGLHIDMGELATNAVVYPSLTFWRKSYEESAFGVTAEASATEIALNGDIRYYFLGAETGTVRPFIGGGPALCLTMAKAEVTTSGDLPPGVSQSDLEADETDFDFGVNFIVGADFVFDEALGGFVEARVKIDGIDVIKATAGVTMAIGG